MQAKQHVKQFVGHLIHVDVTLISKHDTFDILAFELFDDLLSKIIDVPKAVFRIFRDNLLVDNQMDRACRLFLNWLILPTFRQTFEIQLDWSGENLFRLLSPHLRAAFTATVLSSTADAI